MISDKEIRVLQSNRMKKRKSMYGNSITHLRSWLRAAILAYM